MRSPLHPCRGWESAARPGRKISPPEFSLLTLAVAAAAAILVTVPTAAQQPADLARQAAEFERARNFAGAEKVYREMLSDSPGDPDLLLRLGVACQQQSKFEDSIAIFQEILKRAPVYPQVNFFLGTSYYALNRFNDAIGAFQKELAGNPNEQRARYNLALALHASERNLEAIQLLEAMVADQPDNLAALYQLVLFYKDGSQRAFRQLAKVSPDSPWYLALRAQAFGDNEQPDEAIRQFQSLLNKYPGFPGVHFELGQIYWRKKDYELAREELRKALQEDANQPLANLYVGDILTNQKQFQEAIPHLQIAIAAYPELPKAYFFLGKSYAGIGDDRRALEAFRRALELDPRYQEVHYQLSQLFLRSNNKEESQRHLEIVKKLQLEDSKGFRENIEKSSAQQTPSAAKE